MTNEQLLAEIEEILRTIPSGTSFATYGTEGLSWLGRATAVIEAWDALKGTVSRAPRTLTSSISSGPSAFATAESREPLHSARRFPSRSLLCRSIVRESRRFPLPLWI